MVRPLKSILLATNLQEYNKIAFDVAVSLAIHHQAKLVLLHVLEDIPLYAESLLTGLMGREQREEMQRVYTEKAHLTLTGKNISSLVIREALDNYCEQSGMEPGNSGIVSRETIVCDGEVDECIIQTARKKKCEMIVMAAHEGLFSKSSISSVIKSVLQQSTVPVLTVPHVFEKPDV